MDRAGRCSFQVVRREGNRRTGDREIVVLDTDDGLEAEVFRDDLIRSERMTNRTRDHSLRIKGHHPTHNYDAEGRCANVGCRSFNNGSYGSHFPCGFTCTQSLLGYMNAWREARVVAESTQPATIQPHESDTLVPNSTVDADSAD